jgi:hypothetical protein
VKQTIDLIDYVQTSDPLYALGLGAMAFIKGNILNNVNYSGTVLLTFVIISNHGKISVKSAKANSNI